MVVETACWSMMSVHGVKFGLGGPLATASKIWWGRRGLGPTSHVWGLSAGGPSRFAPCVGHRYSGVDAFACTHVFLPSFYFTPYPLRLGTCTLLNNHICARTRAWQDEAEARNQRPSHIGHEATPITVPAKAQARSTWYSSKVTLTGAFVSCTPQNFRITGKRFPLPAKSRPK